MDAEEHGHLHRNTIRLWGSQWALPWPVACDEQWIQLQPELLCAKLCALRVNVEAVSMQMLGSPLKPCEQSSMPCM